jgi:erythromycin esterase
MATQRRSRSSDLEVNSTLLACVREQSLTLHGWEDLDPLLDRVGDTHYVLLGEASHGTSEYYTWRRTISQRLIREKGFSFIAVEGDWPDCYRVNRYIKSYPDSGRSAYEVLHQFARWPTWMWANREIVGLAEWLRQHNDTVADDKKVGFYGLDVYSLWESMHLVLDYLAKTDGAAADAARRTFECFEPFAEDVYEYARAAAWTPHSCEDEVIRMLSHLRAAAPRYEGDGGEAFFNAEQNALVAKNAEAYYRTMVRGDAPSWNVRDRHMVETLNRLVKHHDQTAKAIVWAHNMHVGDARYTDMADAGMVNIGQLVREQHAKDDVVLVGFSSFAGSVVAGKEWGAPMETMRVPPARVGSWEHVLHEAGVADKLLIFDCIDGQSELVQPRGHRAIGVVYRPTYEGYGNYVPTVLPRRYDVILYLDETNALHPLHILPLHIKEPETFPTGL